MGPLRLCVLALALLLALSLTGCTLDEAVDTLRWAFSENAAASPVAASPYPSPCLPAVPTCSPGPAQPSYQERDAIAVAEQYREVYETLYTGEPIGFSLGKDGAAAIVQYLGQAGFCAFSREGVPMSLPEEIRRFMADIGGGILCSAAVYEICDDGGFLCHAFSWEDGAGTVTLTRLTWSDDGEFDLQGTIPAVTYSETYALTALQLSDDVLFYSYHMPDNPEGTNHDGHIDTDISIPLG